MTFMPGKSGNPHGRPKRVDPLSQRLQAFYNKHQQDIDKVGEIALKKAVIEEEPWAIKLCMESFYPKPGRSVAITKEETTAVNVNLSSFTQALSFEDKKTFLKMWMKSKRGIPAFSAEVESDCVEVDAKVLEGSEED
jgi:hypothetical protein